MPWSRLYCAETYCSLVDYAAHGLDPGSFATAVLLGDRPMAYATAHPMLVPEDRGGAGATDVVANMLDIAADRFPHFLRGSNAAIQDWIGHQGYGGAPKERQALFLMFAEDDLRAQVLAACRGKRRPP